MWSRILVVDDDRWVQRVVVVALSTQNFEVDTASDGASALAKALAHPPDLIISDVMMPGMDGWAFVRQVRAHPELALIPFIFLSSLKSRDDMLRGFGLGADDYLSKPIRNEELEARVVAALQRRRSLESAAAEFVQAAPARPSTLSGSLAELGLASLLLVLGNLRKTGVLELRRPRPAAHARLWIRDGRVVGAELDVPRRDDADAIFHGLTWGDGVFEFTPIEVDIADRVGMTMTEILIEGSARLDEALGSAPSEDG